MSPKEKRSKSNHDLRLRKHSDVIYRRLLAGLLEANPSATWAPLARNFLAEEPGDVKALVLGAESLLQQKYCSAEQHFSAIQFCYLVRKYPFPNAKGLFDPEQAALDKWRQSEQRCSETNAKFRKLTWEGELLPKARAFIGYVLGSFSELAVTERCQITPGASIGVHGNATNVARKLASQWSVSPMARDYAFRAVKRNYHMLRVLLERRNGIVCYDAENLSARFLERVVLVNNNKLGFVPKTLRTHRSIAVEPFLNSFLQKGVDQFMREKLLRIGIDLSSQLRNQLYARYGSEDDSEEGFVTIDLSSASDSIATEVVRTLLPYDWFYYLNRIRSHEWKLSDGSSGTYEKFCSMGNGFCFPLQTLLFAAACHAVGCGQPRKDYIVYGDDIIVRRKHAPALLAFLEYLGFSYNAEKTFLEGPFRESCGADWFGGEDVRPFTLDFALDSIENVFKFLNLSERNRRSKAFFSPVRETVKGLLPPQFDFKRPFPGSADTGYQVELDEFMTSPHAKFRRDLQCWSWKELIVKPRPDKLWRGLRDADAAFVFAVLSGSDPRIPFTRRRETTAAVRRVAHG